MNLSEFFEQAAEQHLNVSFAGPSRREMPGLSNEALFHLPLIAMTILMMAGSHRKPKVDRLGQVIGECFERTFTGFKGSSQHLGWSANLRIRTVRALSFLELAKLVETDRTQEISVTERGRAVLDLARDGDSALSFALQRAERNYRDLSVERQLAIAL